MVSTAITTAVAERGPVVISLPGDVAVADAPSDSLHVPLPATNIGTASAADLAAIADLINQAETVAIFGGDGCEQAQDEVRELAARLKAPVGYSFKGKQWLEHDNPNAVGMTGLLGYGGCHAAINHADVLLMLGTDFPFTEFLPHKKVKTIQVDRDPGKIGRRTPLELGVVGDVAATLRALAPMVTDKHGDHFLREHVTQTEHARRRLGHYVTKGPGIKPIRPEYVAAVLSELADDDAVFTVDTGTPCIWAARHIEYGRDRRLFGSLTWASMASAAPNAFGAALSFPGRQAIALCGDGGFTMLALGDLLTQVQRKARVVSVIFNNGLLDFVNIEQQEGGFVPFGTDFVEPGLQPGSHGARCPRHPRRGARRPPRRPAGGARLYRRARRGRRGGGPLRARPALPRPGRDGQGLHAQLRQAGAQRQDGRHHRDRRAQRPAPVTGVTRPGASKR